MSDRADRFTVVLDANVMVGALSRNMLLSLAEAGIFRPRWSLEALVETEAALDKLYGSSVNAKQQCDRVRSAFPEAEVEILGSLHDSLDLPDDEDRHVLAAAIQTKAAVIVTQNLKDFPQGALDPHEIEAKGLDDFLADCIDLAGIEAIAAIRQMRERFKNPDIDAEALILKIEALGLPETARLLTEYKAIL